MKVKQVPQMQDGDSSHTMTINILVKEAWFQLSPLIRALADSFRVSNSLFQELSRKCDRSSALRIPHASMGD